MLKSSIFLNKSQLYLFLFVDTKPRPTPGVHQCAKVTWVESSRCLSAFQHWLQMCANTLYPRVLGLKFRLLCLCGKASPLPTETHRQPATVIPHHRINKAMIPRSKPPLDVSLMLTEQIVITSLHTNNCRYNMGFLKLSNQRILIRMVLCCLC